MSLDATKWAWSQTDVTSTEKLILLSYADRAGETHEAWPAWSRLSLDTSLNRKTIIKGLKSLELKGKIIKTGRIIDQVHVYRLIGVEPREKLSTGTKNGTGKNNTGTKNGTGTGTNFGTTTSTKIGTQNLKGNLSRNLITHATLSPLDFDSFSSPYNYAAALLKENHLDGSDEIVKQMLFYANKSVNKRPVQDSIRIAASLMKKKKWSIPSGYAGITSKSIREKEEQYLRDKRSKYADESVAFRSTATKALGPEALRAFDTLRKLSYEPQHEN